MDAVFEAQFRAIQRRMAASGVIAEVAWTPDGQVDYVYEADRLLVIDEGDNRSRVEDLLPGAEVVPEERQRSEGDDRQPGNTTTLLSIENLAEGRRSVPEALDLLEARDGVARETPLATPNHVLHITRLCPAVEPEVPSGPPGQPWPPQRAAAQNAQPVLIGILDTGLLEDLPHPWLAGVRGDVERLGPALPSGLAHIEQFQGHGTFAAGVARCTAPDASVYVADHFAESGAERENVIINKLIRLVREHRPQVVNLSAGTYTRGHWSSLGFSLFPELFPDVLLVAAAGNDGTSRPFYPAAFPWALAVGALGPDQNHRAWFSNHGPWVDVYALGEGLVNAYATGTYTYREPPRRPARQDFTGMARWDGTSFAAPLVAGIAAAHLAEHGGGPEEARRAVLEATRHEQGVGAVLRV
ncbi:S8/S53 family peptidase [Nonomuraea sp. NPDC050790]|uniref:S8/S53 family peptidase n=1 Tax=Nonomuraea sp. NPDC050790 TaxID=3364371 RepID=UPI0037AB51F5